MPVQRHGEKWALDRDDGILDNDLSVKELMQLAGEFLAFVEKCTRRCSIVAQVSGVSATSLQQVLPCTEECRHGGKSPVV